MDNAKRRVGRPKARPQTGPLVLEGSEGRVKLEVEVADSTAAELKEYVRWVELSSSIATSDATSKTLDFALRQVFRHDRLWQERRRNGSEPAAQPAPAPAAARASKATSAPASSPSSLPPPSTAARPVPSPAGAPADR